MLKRSLNQRACVRIIHVVENASTPLSVTGDVVLRLQVSVARPNQADASLSFRAKSRDLLKLSVLQHVCTQVAPTGVQPVNQCDFLGAGPFFQLAFSRDCVANVSIPLVIYELCAAVVRGKSTTASFAVFPNSP